MSQISEAPSLHRKGTRRFRVERATSPTAGRVRLSPDGVRFVSSTRRQVAAENGQVGRSTQTSSTTRAETGRSWVVATSTNFAIAPGAIPPNCID